MCVYIYIFVPARPLMRSTISALRKHRFWGTELFAVTSAVFCLTTQLLCSHSQPFHCYTYSNRFHNSLPKPDCSSVAILTFKGLTTHLCPLWYHSVTFLPSGTGFCCSSAPGMAQGKGILSCTGSSAGLSIWAHLFSPVRSMWIGALCRPDSYQKKKKNPK